MFFIVPDKIHELNSPKAPQLGSTNDANKRKRTTGDAEETASYYPKRNPKACDRCRLKKARCTGGRICAKCLHDGVICVTSHDSRKPTLPQNPAYVHLVENQRDQLVKVLCQILQNENTANSSKLKSMLANMGIAAGSLALPRSSPNHLSEAVPQSPNQLPMDNWNDLFHDLDDHQIQAIEAFCAASPQTHDNFFAPLPATDSQDVQFPNLDFQALSQSTELRDFSDKCFLASENGTLPESFQACETHNDIPSNRPSASHWDLSIELSPPHSSNPTTDVWNLDLDGQFTGQPQL